MQVKVILLLVVVIRVLLDNSCAQKVVSKDDTNGSLKSLTGHSIFNTASRLLQEFDRIQYNTGTRIIIYNLRKGSDEKFELDFESNPDDIINSEHHEVDAVYRPVIDYVSEYRRSLREYCSILFLKPRMKIVLRERRVHTKLIAKSLRKMQIDFYHPRFLEQPVKIRFGYGPTADCGIMLYHRNRLIKAYEKVGCQKQVQVNQLTCDGAGIVGVVEADFLHPIHNKQEFDKTDRYNTFIHALGVKLNDYKDVMNGDSVQPSTSTDSIDANPWTWAQCDKCNKWRRLPVGYDQQLPEQWFCYMNHDAAHNRCDISEEPEDEDAIMKQSINYKKKLKSVKMQKRSQLQSQGKGRNNRKSLDANGDHEAIEMQAQAQTALEQARLQLEEAQRRESDQLRMIQMLERENRQWKQKQRGLGHNIMSSKTYLANINRAAREGGTQSQSSATKRKNLPSSSSSTAATPSTKRPRVDDVTGETAAPDVDAAGTSTASGLNCVVERVAGAVDVSAATELSDDDDKEVLHQKLIIRLPKQAPNAAATNSVIVIDDSDDETKDGVSHTDTDYDHVVEVKPDTTVLNALIEQQSADAGNMQHRPSLSIGPMTTTSTALVKSESMVASTSQLTAPVSVNSSSTSLPSGSSAVASSVSATTSTSLAATAAAECDKCRGDAECVDRVKREVVETGVQTDDGLGSLDHVLAQQKLTALRTSVLQLLKSIVPTLECVNLEFVDDIVVEMVRVNADNPDN